MNLSLSSVQFKRLVKRLSPVSSESIVLDAVHGVIYAVDSNITIIVTDPLLKAADAEELDGAVSVNSKQFSSLATKTSGDVNIAIVGNRVVVKAKRATFELPIGYPRRNSLAEVPSPQYHLPLITLGEVLSFAATASDPKERHNFTGSVQLRAVNGTLRAVATDHRRLAMGEATCTAPEYPWNKQEFSMLCPVALVQALGSLDGDVVNIAETPTLLFFTTPSTTIIARKLVKPFPLYESLFPSPVKLIVEIAAENMCQGLDNVSPTLLTEDTGVKKMRLVFGNNVLHLYANDGQAKAEDSVECNNQSHTEWEEVGFEATVDHKAITEFFELIKTGPVIVTGNVGTKPILFTAGNRKLLVTTVKA